MQIEEMVLTPQEEQFRERFVAWPEKKTGNACGDTGHIYFVEADDAEIAAEAIKIMRSTVALAAYEERLLMQLEEVKTLQEADALAKKMFGEWAYAHDRVDDRFLRLLLPRYYVGTGSDLYGNGDTWQAAFEAAVKMAARS